jgi:hypothetical protein
MQEQEYKTKCKSQSGVTTEPVSTNRNETLLKEINRNIKTSGVQIRNKVYVCILFK